MARRTDGWAWRAVWSVNPSLPLASAETMQDVYNRSLARATFTLLMLALGGAMALAPGVIGIYGHGRDTRPKSPLTGRPRHRYRRVGS